MPNFERIQLLRDRFADDAAWNEYHEFDMSIVLRCRELENNDPECHTAGCIAGEAILMFAPADDVPAYTDNFTLPMRLLGLTLDEADFMFLGCWTHGVPMGDITRQKVIEYLDSVLANREVRVWI